MKTALLIINYNDYPSTQKLINNVKNYHIIDQIMVVDNYSSDDSVKQLKKCKVAKLKIIESKENKGYSSAINLGCKKLIEEYGQCNIIISNADIIIQKEEDIKKLVSLLKRKEIGIVAPTILEHQNKNRGWKNPSPILEVFLNLPYIHRYLRKKFIYYQEEHYHQETSIVDIVSGCFFLINSDIMKQIDYLDENVFLYYEENILFQKLSKINKYCLIDNQVEVIHNHSVTIDKNINKIRKYKIQKQSQYYYEKNYNGANLFERCLLRITANVTYGILYSYYKCLDWKKK